MGDHPAALDGPGLTTCVLLRAGEGGQNQAGQAGTEQWGKEKMLFCPVFWSNALELRPSN